MVESGSDASIVGGEITNVPDLKHAQLVGFRQACENSVIAQAIYGCFVQLATLYGFFNGVKRFFFIGGHKGFCGSFT